jgi:hypothetical protein
MKFNLDTDQEEVRHILADLGTYCGSITPQAGGRYEVPAGSGIPLAYVAGLGELPAREQDLRNCLLRLGGEDFLDFLDTHDVTTALAAAFARAGDESTAPESVGYVGNAFENFLAGLAATKTPPVDLAMCQGLISKAERLKSEACIATKHLGYASYLGHLRNAADHGSDPETGKQWVITSRSAAEACQVAVSAMLSCFRFMSGDCRL